MKTLVDIMVEKNIRNDTHYEFGTDKEFNHRYCSNFYDKEFSSYKDSQISLLEIGIFRGGSLAVFHEYFPNAIVIAGIDSIDWGSRHNCSSYEKVKVIIGDGYDFSLVNKLPNFDIIIEDGDHRHESHIKFLELYPQKLNAGGVMIIEDIADMAWTEVYKKLVPSTMTWEVVDIREVSNMSDSILFVVRN